jgi:hypothetical protein
VFSVVLAELCPRARCTVTTSQPAAISADATKWRRSCSLIPETPAARSVRSHQPRTTSWWGGLPPEPTNSHPSGRTPTLRMCSASPPRLASRARIRAQLGDPDYGSVVIGMKVTVVRPTEIAWSADGFARTAVAFMSECSRSAGRDGSRLPQSARVPC